MPSLFSKTPPTEDGFYYLKQTYEDGYYEVEISERTISSLGDKPIFWFSDNEVDADELLADGYEFGPRIPPIERLEHLSEPLTAEWLDALLPTALGRGYVLTEHLSVFNSRSGWVLIAGKEGGTDDWESSFTLATLITRNDLWMIIRGMRIQVIPERITAAAQL